MQIKFVTIFVLAVVVEQVLQHVHAYEISICKGGTKPFYFGTTNLICLMLRHRRSAPYRWSWVPYHRWIYYESLYFDFGMSDSESRQYAYGNHPSGYGTCNSVREEEPAGYSNLSVKCLVKCTRSYSTKYGSYSVYGNNCHHFANRMSEVLCNNSSCPDWCT